MTDRPARVDLDDARGSIATVERTLGSAKHFHRLDVEELTQLGGGRIDVDVVVVDRDGARGIRVEVAQPHAANEDRGVGGGEDGADLEVRSELGDVRDVLRANGVDVIVVEDRRGDRSFLQPLLSPLGGDEDLLDATGLPRGGSLFDLGLGGVRRGSRAPGLLCARGQGDDAQPRGGQSPEPSRAAAS